MSTSTRPALGRRPRASDSNGRGQLLDAAVGLFAERGIANTTVAQIAATCGVTSAMVHYWFDTREHLLDAIVEERLAPLFQYIWDPVDTEHGAPLELVRGLVQRTLEVTGRQPWLPSLWLREIINEGGLLREQALRRIPRTRVAEFAQNIARGKARGEVNGDIEPMLVFNSILALVVLPQATAKSWQRIHPTSRLDRAALERHAIGLLMNGLTGAATRTAGRRSSRRTA
jgi:AcrR family transcriptional regulator